MTQERYPTIGRKQLTDEEIEAVIGSKIFQKTLRYRRLAEAIEVLEEEDKIFDTVVSTITKQHSQVRSEDSTREFFQLFVKEVKAHTESLLEDTTDLGGVVDFEDMIVDESPADTEEM